MKRSGQKPSLTSSSKFADSCVLTLPHPSHRTQRSLLERDEETVDNFPKEEGKLLCDVKDVGDGHGPGYDFITDRMVVFRRSVIKKS